MQNTPKDLHRKILGRKGEDLAVEYLKKHKYKILERNFKTPFGEADVIALKGDTYCFIEVKTRTSDVCGEPFEAVDFRKQERYRKIAWHYCGMLKKEVPCRFDVVSILDGVLTYYENAFI